MPLSARRRCSSWTASPRRTSSKWAALEYISSAGLGVLLKTQKRAMATGQGLRLVNANQHIRDIFKYAGFDRIFEIVPAAEWGLTAVGKTATNFSAARRYL